MERQEEKDKETSHFLILLFNQTHSWSNFLFKAFTTYNVLRSWIYKRIKKINIFVIKLTWGEVGRQTEKKNIQYVRANILEEEKENKLG